MIVECISQNLTNEQIIAFGPKYFKAQDYHITVGKQYVVFGLDFAVSSELHISEIQFISDYGHLSFAPLSLFKIVSDKISKLWVTKILSPEHVAIWPPSFFQEYYHDDLSEGIITVVEDFKKIKSLLEQESIEL